MHDVSFPDAVRRQPIGAIVVMGVSGCGKSVVGQVLADALGWRFVEGDHLHPKENVERMSAGIPLTDAHREGWLDTIAGRMSAALADRQGAVAACSALKRRYRDRLRRRVGDVTFVYLSIDRETARGRVGSRTDHFMPASLVDSQFADLEAPDEDERSITIDGSLPVSTIVAEVLQALDSEIADG